MFKENYTIMNHIMSQVVLSPGEEKGPCPHVPLQLCSDVTLTFSDVVSVAVIHLVAPTLIFHTVAIFRVNVSQGLPDYFKVPAYRFHLTHLP